MPNMYMKIHLFIYCTGLFILFLILYYIIFLYLFVYFIILLVYLAVAYGRLSLFDYAAGIECCWNKSV